MGVYERTMHRLAGASWLIWVLSKVATPLDLRLRNSRFAPSRLGLDNPLCYLTTTGRRSGKQRTVPLLYVTVDPEHPSFAVVASNWGKEAHPGWSANLEANPRATLDIEGTSLKVYARRAAEREAIDVWDTIDGVWPGYETYREMAPRDIRVFVLESESGLPE